MEFKANDVFVKDVDVKITVAELDYLQKILSYGDQGLLHCSIQS